MQKKEKPDLIGFILCEDTITDKDSKNISLINIFDGLITPRLPAIHPKIVVFTYWHLETREDVEVLQTVKLLNPENKEIASLSLPARFNRKNRRSYATFNFKGVHFDKAGEYKFQLLIDGEVFKQIPLPVRAK